MHRVRIPSRQMTDYAITFACHNQVDYTRQCVDSLMRHGHELAFVPHVRPVQWRRGTAL